MNLSFYAKKDHVVYRPGPRRPGQVAQYIGRRFVRETDENAVKATGVAGQHRAVRDTFVIDSGHEDAAAIIRYAAKGGLWPADAATAAFIGVELTPVVYSEAEGEWLPGNPPVIEAPAPNAPPAPSAPSITDSPELPQSSVEPSDDEDDPNAEQAE